MSLISRIHLRKEYKAAKCVLLFGGLLNTIFFQVNFTDPGKVLLILLEPPLQVRQTHGASVLSPVQKLTSLSSQNINMRVMMKTFSISYSDGLEPNPLHQDMLFT